MPNLWEVTPMSEALHCDCGVERNDSHETDCLVGAIHGVARSLRLLGNHDAATSMGAIEALGLVVRDGLGDIASTMDRKG